MPKWNPCKRRTFIKKLKEIGFAAPEPGGRHFYMRYGSYTFTVPSNQEYSVPQVKMLLKEVEEGIGGYYLNICQLFHWGAKKATPILQLDVFAHKANKKNLSVLSAFAVQIRKA